MSDDHDLEAFNERLKELEERGADERVLLKLIALTELDFDENTFDRISREVMNDEDREQFSELMKFYGDEKEVTERARVLWRAAQASREWC